MVTMSYCVFSSSSPSRVKGTCTCAYFCTFWWHYMQFPGYLDVTFVSRPPKETVSLSHRDFNPVSTFLIVKGCIFVSSVLNALFTVKSFWLSIVLFFLYIQDLKTFKLISACSPILHLVRVYLRFKLLFTFGMNTEFNDNIVSCIITVFVHASVLSPHFPVLKINKYSFKWSRVCSEVSNYGFNVGFYMENAHKRVHHSRCVCVCVFTLLKRNCENFESSEWSEHKALNLLRYRWIHRPCLSLLTHFSVVSLFLSDLVSSGRRSLQYLCNHPAPPGWSIHGWRYQEMSSLRSSERKATELL